MTDQTTAEDGVLDEELKEGGGKSKKLIIIIAAVVVLLGLGGVGFFLDPLGLFASEDGPKKEVVKVEPAVFFPLEPITVNLNNPEGRRQYLKLKATLEVRSDKDVEAITPFLPRVLDAFQVYLRELRTTDIEGTAGLYRLKEELLKRINIAVYPSEVKDILFEEIIIQ